MEAAGEGCSRLGIEKSCQPAQVAFCLDSSQGAREPKQRGEEEEEEKGEGGDGKYSTWIYM